MRGERGLEKRKGRQRIGLKSKAVMVVFKRETGSTGCEESNNQGMDT